MSNYIFKMPVANLLASFLDEYEKFKSTNETCDLVKCWYAYEALSFLYDIQLYGMEEYVEVLYEHGDKIIELQKFIAD